VSLIGGRTPEIDASESKSNGLERFYRELVIRLNRENIGINSCGFEPLKTVLYNLYCEKLFVCSHDQMQQFEHGIRWYWRKGGASKLSFAPPIGESYEAPDANTRRIKEALDSHVTVALAGQTGTYSTLDQLLIAHSTPKSGFSFNTRSLIVLSWFGGAAAKFFNEFTSRIQKITYIDPEWEAEKVMKNWFTEKTIVLLADRLARSIQRLAQKNSYMP